VITINWSNIEALNLALNMLAPTFVNLGANRFSIALDPDPNAEDFVYQLHSPSNYAHPKQLALRPGVAYTVEEHAFSQGLDSICTNPKLHIVVDEDPSATKLPQLEVSITDKNSDTYRLHVNNLGPNPELASVTMPRPHSKTITNPSATDLKHLSIGDAIVVKKNNSLQKWYITKRLKSGKELQVRTFNSQGLPSSEPQIITPRLIRKYIADTSCILTLQKAVSLAPS